jgi:hypothetical protein
MTRYTPALGKILGEPIFLDGERETVFFAQPPARWPPNTVPYFYMREFEEGLEVLRHVALPPMTHDLLGIALVEFPGLRSVILPSEKSVRLNLRMGMGKYMTLDYPQREQEAFEAEFKERWLKGRREPRSVPSRAYRTLLDFQPLLSMLSTVRSYIQGIKITTSILTKYLGVLGRFL